jgi:hypothetical protein
MKLTQEEKRIKLAEAAGWTKFYESWTGQKKACIPNDSQILPLPDYFNDLNAIYSAEQKAWGKDYGLRSVFVDHLALIMNPVHGYRMQSAEDLLDATAAERAEALGKTLNLWT